MIKDLVVLIKLFLLIVCACFMFGFLFGGFFELLIYISDGETDFVLLPRFLKGATITTITTSLICWFTEYLWKKYKNKNTF